MIQTQGIIDQIKGNKDGSFTIKIETPELTPEDSTKLFSLRNIPMWIGMDKVAMQALDIPDEVVEFKGDKTSSQRLRDVLFVYWETKTNKSQTFEEFRKIQMEKFINLIKDKLD